ncbi:Rhs accessory genetic element [Streptomyces sp. OM5714]|nr:Rhs accessory genetic element [Streptomyces sp. OM5714]
MTVRGGQLGVTMRTMTLRPVAEGHEAAGRRARPAQRDPAAAPAPAPSSVSVEARAAVPPSTLSAAA